MKKKIMSLLLATTMTAASIIPTTIAYADSQKVVTIGADLTEDQMNAVLKYFGVLGNPNVQLIYITNEDERAHLGSYVPLEQIGNRTFSCALVNPTTSGGIQVKTANLSWVTSNMIASTLSTSGVVNCEVLAAAPFEVSGTGALTGVLMAYETATGETLDDSKKDLATQELVTTGQIADTVGQAQATQIVNEIKMQIIEGQVIDTADVSDIVYQVVEEAEAEDNEVGTDEPVVTIDDETMAKLDELAQQIAQQQYDYDEMKETLERVENNMAAITQNQNVTQNVTVVVDGSNDQVTQTEAPASDAAVTPAETETSLSSDSILLNTDDSALGEDVIINATDDAAAPETDADALAASKIAAGEGSSVDGDLFEIVSSDTANVGGADETDGNTDQQNDADTTETTDQGVDGQSTDVQNTDTQNADTQNTDTQESDAAQSEVQAETAALETTTLTLAPEDVKFRQFDNSTEFDMTGANSFSYEVPVADLTFASGNLVVKDEYDQEVVTVDLGVQLNVASAAIDDEKLLKNGWTEGTELIVNLGEALTTEGTYKVELTGEVVQAPEGVDPQGQPTAPIEASEEVTVRTEGFALEVDDMSDLVVGNAVTGNIFFDTDAENAPVSAAMYISDSDVIATSTETFSLASAEMTTEMDANAETAAPDTSFTLYLQNAGETDITVLFYDAAGNEIGNSTQTITVF